MAKPKCSKCCKVGHNRRTCKVKRRKIRRASKSKKRSKKSPSILSSLHKISGLESKLTKDQKALNQARESHHQKLEDLPNEEWEKIYTDIFGNVWDQIVDLATSLGAGQDDAADAADIIAGSVIRRLSGEF